MDKGSRAIGMSILSSARVQQRTNVNERAQHKTQFEKYNDEGVKIKVENHNVEAKKEKKKKKQKQPKLEEPVLKSRQ